MNNDSLINNIYINILCLENSFSKKAMVSRNILKKIWWQKNLVASPSPLPPPPLILQGVCLATTDPRLTVKRFVLGVFLVMAVGKCGRGGGGWKGNGALLRSLPAPSPAAGQLLSNLNPGDQLYKDPNPPCGWSLITVAGQGTGRWQVGEQVQEPGAEPEPPQQRGLGLMWTELLWRWRPTALEQSCPLWPDLSLQGCDEADRAFPERKNKTPVVQMTSMTETIATAGELGHPRLCRVLP